MSEGLSEDVAADTPPPLPKCDPRFDFDVLLVGGGQTSVPVGPKLCKRGYRVALAEQRHMGGSCINFGCYPSKAVHASARVAHLARRGADFGIDVGPVRPSLPEVLLRARAKIEEAERHITRHFDQSGVRLFAAHARLAGRTDDGEGFRVSLDAGGQISSVTARVVVLDTGSKTRLPDIPGLAEADPITAETWPTRDALPRRLLMLGGGYIGIEQAQFYRRIGAAVTVVESGPQILSREDPDVAGKIKACLEGEGVAFRLGARLTRVTRDGELFVAEFQEGEPLEFDGLFVATGRPPSTRDLGLDTVGVEPDDKGYVTTDPFGETCVPGLYAAGDIRGGGAFTHSAHDDHHILLGRLLGHRDPGGSRSRANRIVPYAVFTDPELGRVGMSESAARQAGLAFEVVTVPMNRNDRAQAIGEVEGFVKLVVARETGKLLGAAVIGPGGGELIHAFIVLMHLDRPLLDLLDAIFIHPTLFEIVHSSVDAYYLQTNGPKQT